MQGIITSTILKIVCKLEATDSNLSYQRMQQGR